MARQQTYVLGGKEFNVWTETQLFSINRDALKKRCMDLRDSAGQDRLPPMPRQPDGMVAWMLEVQGMVMGANQPAAYQADDVYDGPLDRGPHGSYDQAPPSHDRFDRSPPGGTAYGGHDQDLPSRSYDQAPHQSYDQGPPRGYTPSNAGSIAESRAGALGSTTLIIAGKEWNVWTEKQLSSMGRESLKKRCIDFRDLVGKDQLRPMPRHPEAMVDWLLNAQAMVMEGGGDSAPAPRYEDQMAQYARGPPGGMARGGPPQGMGRGGPEFRGYEPSEAPTEAQSNYETNMEQAKAIRLKNQGSVGLW